MLLDSAVKKNLQDDILRDGFWLVLKIIWKFLYAGYILFSNGIYKTNTKQFLNINKWIYLSWKCAENFWKDLLKIHIFFFVEIFIKIGNDIFFGMTSFIETN